MDYLLALIAAVSFYFVAFDCLSQQNKKYSGKQEKGLLKMRKPFALKKIYVIVESEKKF